MPTLVIENNEDYNRLKSILKDISTAKEIQKSLLGVPFEDTNIKVTSLYIPSKELAGDLYCWFQIDEFRYGIILIDVMGHGIPSALISMSVRSLLKGIITRLVNPISVINELNNHMINLYFNNQDTFYYFTTLYMVIDIKNKEIEYTNAGHPPAIAIVDNKDIIEMKEGSIAVGLMPKITVKKIKITYSDNVKFLLFTDGIFDAIGKTPKESIEYFKNKIRALGNKNGEIIIDDIFSNDGNSDFQDDICVITINTK